MKKFRDPKTGEVFNTIEAAVSYFRCPGPCADCPIVEKVHGFNGCVSGVWWKEHPAEAARLMGYEVIDDTPTDTPTVSGDTPTDEDINVPNKPLSEWTLGEVREFCIKRTESGNWEGLGAECEECPMNVVCAIPASDWTLKKAPHLTEAEMTIMRAVGAKWVSLAGPPTNAVRVELWTEKPEHSQFGSYIGQGSVARVNVDLFPSVKPGDLIEVGEEE